MGVWTHRTDGNSRRAIRAYTCAKVKENNGTLVGHACGPLTSFALGEKSFRTPCIAFYRDHAGILVALPRLLPLRSEPTGWRHDILRQLNDFKGQELIDGVIELVDRFDRCIFDRRRRLRSRELQTLLPILLDRGIHVQLVTSAFR